MTAPDQYMIDQALRVAAQSPCRSKRGVVIYDMENGAFRGSGCNGPPNGCPGRATCAGTCGQRAVHAEMRALRQAEVYYRNGYPPGPYDLIHVELAADGGVVACAGPSCPGCAAQILDVGFVGGVWLYEVRPPRDERRDEWCVQSDCRCEQCPYCQDMACLMCGHDDFPTDPCPHAVDERHRGMSGVVARWRRYTAAEFYEVTMRTVRP